MAQEFNIYQSELTAEQMENQLTNAVPRINATNYHWEVYDVDTDTWVDTGVKARGEGGGTALWGEIEGTLSNQTDLQNALNSKGTYSKPSGGIPSTDMSSAVQTSLGKADSALQSHQDISGKYDKTGGTITGVLTVNNASYNGYVRFENDAEGGNIRIGTPTNGQYWEIDAPDGNLRAFCNDNGIIGMGPTITKAGILVLARSDNYTASVRNTGLVSSDTTPSNNGEINWTYA